MKLHAKTLRIGTPRAETFRIMTLRAPRRRAKAAPTARLLLLSGLAAAAGLATVASTPAAVVAQRGGGMGMGGFRSEGQRLWTQLDQRYDEFAEALSLTADQSGLLAIVVEDFRQTNEDALGRMVAMTTEMRGLLGGGRPDRAAVAEIAEKHGNPARELVPAFETLKIDVADLLDPEQLEAMNRLLSQRPRRPPPGAA